MEGLPKPIDALVELLTISSNSDNDDELSPSIGSAATDHMASDEDNGKGAEAGEGDDNDERDRLSKLKVCDLKELLKERGLKISAGNKADLVARLLDDDGGNAARREEGQPLLSSDSTSILSSSTGVAAAGAGVERTMVFCNMARTAALVCEQLNERGVPALPYHKDVAPEEREANLHLFASSSSTSTSTTTAIGDLNNGFEDNKSTQAATSTTQEAAAAAPRVLVCTDLAARGIDVVRGGGGGGSGDDCGSGVSGVSFGGGSGVDRVVQFDFAANVVQHLHRLGRTARAGRPGKATHFIAPRGSPGAALADHIRAATEEGRPLEESFSRKRGFRKKIKKTGQPFNSSAGQKRQSGGAY